MKQISQYFKDNLAKYGREYKNEIDVYSSLYLGTENNNDIITQDNMNVIAKDVNLEQDPTYTITDENLYQIKLITKGEMLHTLMKELDFETTLNLNIGSVVKYRFGLKIEETNEYEYLDYGKFIIYKKEYNEDTEHYTYTCYDYMLKTMVLLDDDFNLNYNNYQYANKVYLSGGTEPIEYYMTTPEILKLICGIFNFNININYEDIVSGDIVNYLWHYLPPYPSGATVQRNDYYVICSRQKSQIDGNWYDNNANFETLRNRCKTYRDVLDMICGFMGFSIYIENDELMFKSVEGHTGNEIIAAYDCSNPKIADTINESFLKNKSVKFGKVYGPINAVNTYWSEEVNGYAEDSQSVTENGITKIQNESYFWKAIDIQEDTQNVALNLLATVDGVKYNTYDIQTYGILYLDWLDYFNVTAKGNTYKCLLLNSEITIKNGIGEKLYTPMKQEQPEQYVATSKDYNDYVADTIRARKSAYANGEKLIGESYVTYSSNEMKCGFTEEGKPIYRKIFKDSNVLVNSSYAYYTDITDIDEVIDFKGLFNLDGDYERFPTVYYDNNGYEILNCFFRKSDCSIRITGNGYWGPRSTRKLKFIVEYTKTTD